MTHPIQAYLDCDPCHASAGASYWAAHATLSHCHDEALLAAFFAKELTLRPEVKPDLAHLGEAGLSAFASVTRRFPESAWCCALSGDPSMLKQRYQWLHDAWQAPSCALGGTAAQQDSMARAAQDAQLVRNLQELWPRFIKSDESRRPVGWAGILLREGSPASIAVLEPMLDQYAEDSIYDCTLDDLRALVPPEPAPAAARLATRIKHILDERDAATGQFALFAVLEEQPATFSFSLQMVAKSGHRFLWECSRSWRCSGIVWYLSVGKKQPVFSARQHGVERNKPGFPPLRLDALPAWLAQVAAQLRTRWLPGLEMEQEGLTADMVARLSNFLEDKS